MRVPIAASFVCLVFAGVLLAPARSQSLVAHWKFDETAGGIAKNEIVGSPPGVLSHFSEDNSQWVEGKVQGAIRFDGVDDFVSISNFPYAEKGEFTIMFWYSCLDNHGERYRYLFSHGGSKNWEKNSVFIYFSKASTQRTRLMDQNDETAHTYLDLSIVDKAPADGTWHHYALTTSMAGSVVYIDGKEAGRLAGGGDPMNPTVDIVLGTRNDKMDTRYYDGKLDDLRIYDYALSAEQVGEACLDFSRGGIDSP